MRFSVTKNDFSEPLKQAASACAKGKGQPILSHVLLSVEESGLVRITGTDLTIEVATQSPAQVEESGCVAVPAAKLRDIVGSVTEDDAPIRFALNSGQVEVRHGKSRFKLRHLPADTFPNVEIEAFTLARTMAEGDLKDLLTRVSPAMAKADVRYYLNGMYLSFEGDALSAVATDGHRLNLDVGSVSPVDTASYSLPSEFRRSELAETDADEIIPREAVAGVIRMLGGSSDPVIVALSPSHFQLRRGSSTYTTKLIEGQFPNYNRVIPELQSTPIQVDREALRQSLERVRILSHEATRGVKLEIESGRITMRGSNADAENAQEAVEVDYSGEALEIGFNVDYLVDALKTAEGETVSIHLTQPNASGLILPDIEQAQSQFVVMPMRL